MIVTYGSFEPHPTGLFQGEVTRIEKDVSQYDGKPQLVFTIGTTPLHGEKIERSMLYWTSTSFSPKSKLGGLYMAVTGEEIHAGLAVDTEHLLNQQALVEVEHYTRQDGRTGSRINAWKALN